MNLRNLEADFRRREGPKALPNNGVLQPEAFTPLNLMLIGSFGSGKRTSSYWKAQLVICSVLLHEPHYEKWDLLRKQVDEVDVTQEELKKIRSKMFSPENIKVDDLPEEVRAYYSEVLLRGGASKEGENYLEEMTMRTLKYTKDTTVDPEEVRLAELGLEWMEQHLRGKRKRWR